MSQIVKLRRSSVPGQKPTNSNLQLGELALNTADGKVYMAKSGSLGPSVEELISTNTVNTGSIFLTNNVTASFFTGSFIGNGQGLYDIPASGITGLNLSQIANGSATASIDNNGLEVNVPLSVTGSITATQFTGSALGLTNVPFHITGSDVDGNAYNKQFTKLQFDDSTGLNVSESVAGTAFISIGSHFRDIIVQGSSILRATGSDAFEVMGVDGISITTSITDTNSNGYVKELKINATSLSSSLDNRINVITGSISGLNNFTSSVVLTSQTGSMTVLSASYAETASYALNAGGSSIGSYSSLVVTSAASTWSFSHNTGQRYPIFQIFDNNGYVVIPSQIQTIDDNNANIIFPSPQTGRVIASLGGGNGLTQPFTSSSLWTVNHNLGTDYPDVTVWDSNRNIVFPNRIESVNANQIKIYFSQPITGNVSVSRGGHIVSGSVTWDGISGKPSGIVSGSSQLTGAYDARYVLSGSITQTTWDNIANKPAGIVSGSSQVIYSGITGIPSGIISGSIQVDITNTTNYTTFSSSIDSSISSSIAALSASIATTDLSDDNRLDALENTTSSLNSYTSSNTTNINAIHTATSSLNTFTSSANGRLNSLETESGSIRTDFNTFTSSYNTGSFTGSFIGNGSELFNIPASGVTGLQLNKIISGNASASIDNTGLYVNRNVYIDGTLSAKELNITLVSSSVLFESGSSKFGDTSNDTHQFTGSILISGSILSTSTALVSGSSQIVYSGLTGIPSDIVSGSSQLTGSYDTRYVLSGSITQTTWDNIANKPSGITSGSSQIVGLGFLETSSFNTYTSSNDGRVSSLESKTGSYATTGSNSFIGTERVTGSLIVSSSLNVIGTQNINGNLSVTGSVVISGSLDISNANVGSSRYLHTQTSTSATWSITHNLGYDYPNVTVYDGSNNKVMLPADVTSVNQNTTQVTFATPEYGYALVSVGGVTTATADRYLHTVSSATGSWVINHNFNYKYVNIDVYDNNDEQLIPQKVTAVSANTVQVDFATPTSGNAIITTGGPRSTTIFNQTGSFYNTQNNIGITGSLVVTGDVDASNFNTTSDKLIKTNIEKIEGALDKIEKLNGYTFNWLEEYNEDRTRQIGLLANEVNEVQPELTTERVITLGDQQQKILLLDYSKVTALLIEAVKELNDKVKKLENKRKKKWE